MKFQVIQKIFPSGIFRKPSVLVIIFSACFAFWFVDFWRPYNASKNQHNFSWDVLNYYSYLPAIFCNDGSFDLPEPLIANYLPVGPKGIRVPKTTYGMSLMYSPFFALGYKIAYNQKSPLNGASEPFTTSIHWGSIFYSLLGLVFLRKLLLPYFNETIIALTLFSALFGSMLFFYTYTQSESTHGYLFMLISLFLYLTQLWHHEQKLKYMVWLGFVLGLISLIRPTEISVFIFFLLWDVKRLGDFKPKFQFLLKHYKQLLLLPVLGFLIWLPQFLFWKENTGTYLYFSYPGERFFWGDPQIINILFSYRKGWLVYTPLILLAFIGFFFVKKEFPLSKWTLFLFTVGMVYLLSCWWDWFFGGCFGARGFCQHIAYLSIPIAFLFDFVFYSPKKYLLKNAVTLLTAVFTFSCVCQNLGQSYQFHKKFIHYHAMTKQVYWDLFRTYQYPEEFPLNYWNNLVEPNYEKMRNGDRDQ